MIYLSNIANKWFNLLSEMHILHHKNAISIDLIDEEKDIFDTQIYLASLELQSIGVCYIICDALLEISQTYSLHLTFYGKLLAEKNIKNLNELLNIYVNGD